MNGSAPNHSYGGPSTSRGGYHHYKDLFASAQDQIRPNSSVRLLVYISTCPAADRITLQIKQLLDRASNALHAANTQRDFGRPDYAFVEFIVAQLIIFEALPRQKDFPGLADHPRLQKQYDDCRWVRLIYVEASQNVITDSSYRRSVKRDPFSMRSQGK